MAVFFAAGDVNTAAAFRGSRIVQFGDLAADSIRLFLGVRHLLPDQDIEAGESMRYVVNQKNGERDKEEAPANRLHCYIMAYFALSTSVFSLIAAPHCKRIAGTSKT